MNNHGGRRAMAGRPATDATIDRYLEVISGRIMRRPLTDAQRDELRALATLADEMAASDEADKDERRANRRDYGVE